MNQFEDVPAKSLSIRGRVARFENPGIDTASKMFDKGAKEAPVELGNAEIRVHDYSGFFVHGNIGQGIWRGRFDASAKV